MFTMILLVSHSCLISAGYIDMKKFEGERKIKPIQSILKWGCMLCPEKVLFCTIQPQR